MEKFTKFTDWEANKYKSVTEDAIEKPTESESNATLLAQISELVAKRKKYVKYKEDFKAQILDIDIKLLKLEVDKNNLREQRRQLEGASKINDERSKEAKTNTKDE
jgi:hypothetical protein